MQVKGNFLRREELEKLHEATLDVLANAGVKFQHPTALDIFRRSGAKVDGNTVFIHEGMLREAIASIPSSFLLLGRERENDVLIGGSFPVFASSSGCVYAMRGREKYLAQDDDFVNFIKLTETSPVLNVTNYIMVEPQDLPIEKRKLHQVAACLKYSSKPLIGNTLGREITERCFELLRRFYGSLEPNRLLGIISPISPLLYDEHMLDHVIQYAEAGQPMLFASCSLPGASSPVTLSGTLVIDNAEVLAGIVLAQLIKPGLPVIYGNTSTSCDLRYVSPAIGSPETGLITIAASELSKFYGIPCRSGGTLTDSKLTDMQAGIESAFTIIPALLSGVDFILQACGILDTFNAVSYEKFVIDEETLKMAKRFTAGFEINDQLLGLEMVKRLGPGASFLAEEHTDQHFRSELYLPTLATRLGYAQWEKNGGASIDQRAWKVVEKRLAQYKAPDLTAAQAEVLQQYL